MAHESDIGGVSFKRGLNVLICVAESGEASAHQIAANVGVPLSTVYRYLRTLRELELIEERDGSYVPGWRLLELSGQDLAHTRLVEVGHSFLREVSGATGETAVLTVRAGTQALCMRQVESSHAIRMAFKINQLLPLYAGAGQRMLLAHAPPSVIDRVLENPLRHITDQTLDRVAVTKELDQIRRHGFLVTRGELSEGAVAVAVPVFAGGEIVCSLTAAGPEYRCGALWQGNARATLVASAARLTDVLDDGHQR
jgi:DNA-binding IclR family transcriptional regulator